MKKLIFHILFLTPFILMSQKSEEELLRVPYTSTTDQTNREYFVYLPKGYYDEPNKEWPILLFLHGHGERGNGKDELDYVMIHGPLYEAWIQKRNLPFVIIVPQLHVFDFKDKFINRNRNVIPVRLKNGVPKKSKSDTSKDPMLGTLAANEVITTIERFPQGWDLVETDIIHMIDNTLTNYNTDKNRVYLSGLSYGGAGAFYIGSRNTEKFAAINPIVGWGSPEMMEPIAKAQLPIWVFAGGLDNVVPVSDFYKGLNKLKELGHKDVRFTIHEDLGHDAWKRIYAGKDIYDWFLEHHK